MLDSRFLRVGHFCFVLIFRMLCCTDENNLRLFAQICPDCQLMYLCIRNPIIAGNINNMESKILKVVRQGEAFSVQSSKQESGQIQKCNILLRELGGSKYENEFVCTMLGSLAECRFFEGDVVAATLRFSTHEYQGQVYQEILVTDIIKVNR